MHANMSYFKYRVECITVMKDFKPNSWFHTLYEKHVLFYIDLK